MGTIPPRHHMPRQRGKHVTPCLPRRSSGLERAEELQQFAALLRS